MISKKVSVFLPTRKGSERVLNKNTRKFSNIEGGLLELKLKQLIKVQSVSEVVLSTNDEECMSIANGIYDFENKIKIITRPDSLALSSTNLTDLVAYVPSIVKYSHILWTHVTSPFVLSEDYENAIIKYFYALKNGYDSLMSVKKFQNFLWSDEKNDIINRINNQKWPKTQDLKALFEINSAIFIACEDTYRMNKDRIGKTPILFEQDNLKSFDIDWEDDFELAEFIYNKKISK